MKTFHLIFGVAIVVVFLLTGQYMDRYLNHLVGTPDLQRMFYRSRHIYILMVGLLNIGIGSYFSYRVERWRVAMQLFGSLFVAIASVLFVLAFIYEPPTANFNGQLAREGIYLSFAGTLLHLISGLGTSRRLNRREN